MGANLVNSMCEEVAPLIEQLTGGKVFLRILSNLASHSMVTAECLIPADLLGNGGFTGEEERDGIVLANQFAEVDPYRATTHNKGIMNGIDAVALATGNDWRAIEASAHAYASLQGRYRALTRWWATEDGHLAGSLSLPLKVGTVGGQMQSNPAAGIAHRILGVTSARELAEVMCAVGLAQNLSAIRALSTHGIQRGHMALHARSVAVAAGAPPALFEEVVGRLIESRDIKVWRAQEILEELGGAPDHGEAAEGASVGTGHAKIILLGEHAVVYGRHALAVPVPLAMRATIEDAESDIQVLIPQWNVTESMPRGAEPRNSLEQSLQMIFERVGLDEDAFSIRVQAHVPRAMGLGGSAALAVAVIRAAAERAGRTLTDDEVNALAYESEKFAHGRPSGIDNAVATYGRPLLYQRGDPPVARPVEIGAPVDIVVGLTRREGLTAAMVARVAEGREKSPASYERIFDELDALTLEGCEALEKGDWDALGRCMNLSHGLLNALQVSTHELERLVEIARRKGAAGAKLTGAGGGGAVIALAPEGSERIAKAMRGAGYRSFVVRLGEDTMQGAEAQAAQARIVSFDDEPLIVVNDENEVQGYQTKVECHAGEGILHRAFSVFLFNEQGQLLLQQRSEQKPLWPLFWANSCCSHPRRGEVEIDAAHRRVQEELGVAAELDFLYRFQYFAPYEDKGAEREVCSVILGRTNQSVQANENEIAQWRWIAPADLDRELEEHPERFTPWLKLEWAELRSTHAETLAKYTAG